METTEGLSVPPRAIVRHFLILSALLPALPATAAQLYKWTDERGAVVYSDRLPADAGAATRMKNVEDRVSVYTPDAKLVEAIAVDHQRYAQDARTASLDQRFERTQPSAQGAQEPVAGIIGGYYPYGIVVRRPPRLHSAELPLGATAGNVVGTNGFIPGNSASAPAGILLPRSRR
jgi:hypothetical protein